MKAVIFGNAHVTDYSGAKGYVEGCGLIICCDGGVRHTFNMNIMPDIIIGDFDSADSYYIDYYKTKNIPFKSYTSKKDRTDMEICLVYAIESGADDIVILGGIGSRFDHSLANVFLLQLGLEKNVNVCICNENNKIHMIDKEIRLKGKAGEFVSAIPITREVRVVCTQGLEYPLRNETIFMNSSRGISNRFCSDEAYIKIESGLLLVIRAND